MIKNKSRLLLACLALLFTSNCLTANAQAADKKKLKVVILMGQSNMVGFAHPKTAWYLTQELYVPPPKVAEIKTDGYSSGNFYWTSVSTAYGDSEEYNAKGPALLAERKALIKLWRTRAYDNFSRSAKADNWNYKEWGPAPEIKKLGGMRPAMNVFLSDKIRKAQISKRMQEVIESPENKFHPSVAIKEMAKRDELIADDLKRVRDIFLKGTKPEDFDAFDEALKDFGRVTAENRMEYMKLAQKHINLPIPKRTHISALGAVAGEPLEGERQSISQGPLTLGYSYLGDRCGPEYPFGVCFERLVDGPVLLIKCAWGGKSIKEHFRPPSLNCEEYPTGIYWKISLEHIKSVLANPGKYCPNYDPKAGYELEGLVWFQGWNDKGNTEYGKQLVHFIKDFRKELKAPNLPVVCGLLGHSSWAHTAFADGDVNAGMLYAAQHPDLKGTVDIVNTLQYYPIELNFRNTIKEAFGAESPEYKKAEQIIGRATSKDGCHYHGSAKFMYLTGDAMARKLANLVKDGQPTIHKEAEEILGKK